MTSNELPGRKWVVTKAAGLPAAAYCWSVPFDAVAGQVAEIALNDANAVNLADRSWP